MSGEEATCGCVIGGLHRYACAGVGHVDPPSTPTPVPSEVAETTAGEREVEAVEALAKVVVRAFGVRPMAAEERREIARAVLASDWLAALLDRVRREEGERIAQAIERIIPRLGVQDRELVLDEATRIARAASVGRGEGL